jgi:hypothetical protein
VGKGESGGPKRKVGREQTSRGVFQREWTGILRSSGGQDVWDERSKRDRGIYIRLSCETLKREKKISNVRRERKEMQ